MNSGEARTVTSAGQAAPSALTHVAAQRILLIELVELIFDDIEISCRDHKSVEWGGGGVEPQKVFGE